MGLEREEKEAQVMELWPDLSGTSEGTPELLRYGGQGDAGCTSLPLGEVNPPAIPHSGSGSGSLRRASGCRRGTGTGTRGDRTRQDRARSSPCARTLFPETPSAALYRGGDGGSGWVKV